MEKNRIEAIPKDQIQKIKEAYLLQEVMIQNSGLVVKENGADKGILTNLKAGQYFPKGQNRERG